MSDAQGGRFEAKYHYVLYWNFDHPQSVGFGTPASTTGIVVLTIEENRRRREREEALATQLAGFTPYDVAVLRSLAEDANPEESGYYDTTITKATGQWLTLLANRIEALLPPSPGPTP